MAQELGEAVAGLRSARDSPPEVQDATEAQYLFQKEKDRRPLKLQKALKSL